MTDRPRVRIEPFSEQTAVGPEDVASFWRREGAIPEDVVQRRLGQIVLVAVTDDEAVAAVATAHVAVNARLGMPLWHFRAFVGAGYRRTSIARRFAYAGRDHLREQFVSGRDVRAGGILYELHSQELAHADQEEWRRFDFAFIGETERGDHVRVHYFPGAHAPPPPVAQGSA